MPDPIDPAPARSSTARFVVAVLLVAALATGAAIGFRASLSLLLRASTGARDVVAAVSAAPAWARVLVPTLGGALVGLIAWIVARAPEGQGVGDVMEAVVLGRVRLSMRVTALKSLASFVAIASGGSIGREGPLIQLGGAFGKLVGERLAMPALELRTLVAAGSAAGFAAAYNTPFAAVLFVLEVVSGIVSLDLLVPTLLATVLATSLTRVVLGPGPVYGQRGFALVAPTELLAFLLLGLVAALGARAFVRLLSFGEDAFRPLPQPLRATLGGLLCGLVLAVSPLAAGNGYEPLGALLDGALPLGVVATLVFTKALATTASVGSGSPGGIFTPTLLLGGALGFLFASGLHHLGVPIGPAGGYALVGMAAATSATTHAPLMAAVMVFELSGDYQVVLPLLLATAIATYVSRRLDRDSIYTRELRRRGIGWQLTIEGRTLDGSGTSSS